MGCVIHLYYMFKQLEVTQIPCLVGDNTYVPVLHVIACKKFTAKGHSLGHHMRISKIICSSLSFSFSLFLSKCGMLCSRFHFFFAFLFCFCCLLWVLTLKEVEGIFKLERLFFCFSSLFFRLYIWYTNNICVFYFNVDNIWVNGEAIDELWSWWMDWVTKEGVCTCNWRLLHCCFASLLRHLPQSHQSTMFLLIMWHLFVFIFYLFIKTIYLVFEEIDERKKKQNFSFPIFLFSLQKRHTE